MSMSAIFEEPDAGTVTKAANFYDIRSDDSAYVHNDDTGGFWSYCGGNRLRTGRHSVGTDVYQSYQTAGCDDTSGGCENRIGRNEHLLLPYSEGKHGCQDCTSTTIERNSVPAADLRGDKLLKFGDVAPLRNLSGSKAKVDPL